MINLQSEISGRYKIEVKNKNGDIKSTGWFKNLITNKGKDYFGHYSRNSLLSLCKVGTSNTTPSSSDVDLYNAVAYTTTKSTVSQGLTSSSPYYAYASYLFTFAIGAVTGNIAEVGVGWGTSNSLFSRALILDGTGNPTTITVLSDEQLTVTYELRMSIPEIDSSGTITLNGSQYTWTSRAANATSDWIFYTTLVDAERAGASNGQIAYDGSIGVITSLPSGNFALSDSFSADAYVNGNYFVDHSFTFGLSKANFASGIGAVSCAIGSCRFQIGFSPKIPKTSSQIFTLKLRHSWS